MLMRERTKAFPVVALTAVLALLLAFATLAASQFAHIFAPGSNETLSISPAPTPSAPNSQTGFLNNRDDEERTDDHSLAKQPAPAAAGHYEPVVVDPAAAFAIVQKTRRPIVFLPPGQRGPPLPPA
jgi:hypothetical protein